jgi:chemotaxis family two-component system response regulator Rcp1
MMSPSAESGIPIDVLLVEDSPHYVRLIKETFREVNTHVHFHVASDGVEAMAFLRDPGVANPRPDLILLDLGMPKMDGREVLAKLKEDDNLKTIPTLVLTTSEAQRDVASSYQLHANSFLQKPLRLEQLDALVKSINDFWFVQSKLPEKP